MRSDLVNELLILQKWRDSSSLIKLTLAGSTFSVQAWARVVEAGSVEIALNLLDGAGFIVFDPSRCALRYQDSREADESVKEDVESKVISALSVSMPEDVDLLLYEWIDEGEPL